ncbi:hypothetical protein RhiirA4_481027 [Rhizophagus irregularis]|uniref:SAM domain-containing protein n=1 Tax=Rhizophagus irregularis TaxID=588596 RepID=A0A2I1HIX1_9GLOM|nr:hypothetical protein RhiirA4_481027 [Rhizophagus irregularis]
MSISKVKRLNTEKLIKFLSEEIQLDEDDLDIIHEKKVSGRAFIKLTEDKLEEWGVADGSVLAILDFVEELRGEGCKSSSMRRKVEGEDIILPRVKYIFTIFLGLQYPTPVNTNATNNLANSKGNLLESKLRVHAFNNIIDLESGKDPTNRKRKHDHLENSPKISPLRSPSNKDFLLDTPNKRQMSDEKVIQYLNAMEQSLKHNKVTIQTPSLWTESLISYIDNVLKISGDEFKMEIMRKIEGDESNDYNLVDIFPNLSRKIGERKYIVQNVSSLFKFYESTFGNLYFDWIETRSPASKLTKSRTYSGIVKVDAKGEQYKFIYNSLILTLSFNNEVSGPPSSLSSQYSHAVNDTTKSIHTDILNLIAILLDYLRVPIEIATKIKVFSLHVIEYRITLYSLNMLKDGTFLTSELYSTLLPFSLDAISKYKGIFYMMAIFHEEITDQISIMKNLDFTINYNNYNEESTVRDVLKIPKVLKDLLEK